MHEIEIQASPDGPGLLILAGVHGDEYEPILAAMELSVILKEKLRRGSVRIVPVVNRTAYFSGQRCGDDGLDLARSCPGDIGGLPTMQDAAKVSVLIQNCDYLIDLHTGGHLYDMYPLAGYMLHPDKEVLAVQRKMANAFGLPLVWGTDPFPDGRTLSVARDENKPAIYAEYGGPGPVRGSIVNTYVQGCLNVMGFFDMLTDFECDRKEPLYLVEDAQPDSGHLQGMMRSSADGIFVPKVRVGEHVQKGQLWGVIYTYPGCEIQRVYADADGLALFVRSQPRIKEQESLGGIIMKWNNK